jgi:hypothetical protein
MPPPAILAIAGDGAIETPQPLVLSPLKGLAMAQSGRTPTPSQANVMGAGLAEVMIKRPSDEREGGWIALRAGGGQVAFFVVICIAVFDSQFSIFCEAS